MKVKILVARANVIDSSGYMFTPACLKASSGKTIQILENFDYKKPIANALLEYEPKRKHLYITEIWGLGDGIELKFDSKTKFVVSGDGLCVIKNGTYPCCSGVLEKDERDGATRSIKEMSSVSISFCLAKNADKGIVAFSEKDIIEEGE